MGLQGIQPEGSLFAAAPITTCGTTLQMVFFLLRSFVLVLKAVEGLFYFFYFEEVYFNS